MNRVGLNEDKGLSITYTPLSHILTKAGFISPLCNRSTRKAKKKAFKRFTICYMYYN